MKSTFTPKGVMLLFVILISSTFCFAQVGINTTTPNGILDINSSTQGFVLPRVALTSTLVMAPVTNPQTGAIAVGTTVYNTATTNTGANDVFPGIYTWNGSEWYSQYQRRQYALYESSVGYRSTPGSTLTIPLNGSSSPTFTAKYTGNYKIRVRVDFGGGGAIVPNEGSGGSRSDGDLNIARATGNFTFTFNGTNYTIPAYSYSTAYNNVSPSTNYFAIWQEFIINEVVTLNANDTVNLSLTFLQDTAEEFLTTSTGRGYVSYDIPCVAEVFYVGE
ncbi:MAG: hypothetical protein HKN48_02790 [Flavobacteriaceae bacterium]|nr:hypothetical protein [Flavobacteriaceae bacterium]